jgi:cytochrome P450
MIVYFFQLGLTHEEVLAQGIMFLLVGFETTASTISFLGYLLATNTDCQDKLCAEIDEVLEGKVSLEFVQKKALNAFIWSRR